MLQDLRQALRSLAKRPSSAILTVVVFALAIGANTTVFSAFNGFLLRPMPFPDDGLVMVYASAPKMGLDDGGTDVEGFLEWRKAPALEAGAIFTTSERTLQGGQQAGGVLRRFVYWQQVHTQARDARRFPEDVEEGLTENAIARV